MFTQRDMPPFASQAPQRGEHCMMKKIGEQNEKLAFTYQETARAANISVAMVRKLVRTKQIEAVQIGRCVRIPRHALLKLCGVQ
jgi:excisionase family DNA binding protein